MGHQVGFVLTRRFLPLFLTQFFGAANDNFLKNAMLIMITYQLGESTAAIGAISNLAAALFILPYFLFSTLAGQFADKFDRAGYSQIVKLVEIVLMLAAGFGFTTGNVPMLMTVLFFMGAQSAFFSPAKYSLLPLQLHGEELLAGNAWINGGTYIAILAGAMSGGVLIALPNGRQWCGAVLIAAALIGYFASRAIPAAPAAAPDLTIDWNIFRQTFRILRHDLWQQPPVRFCALTISVFWLAGSLYITQLPLFTRDYVGGDERICTMFFVLFAVGVGIGSGLADRIFKNAIRYRNIVLAMVTMGIFTMDLAVIIWTNQPCTQTAALPELLTSFRFYRAAFDLLMISVTGGIWSVPLNTLMQRHSQPSVLARVIAGNNIINSLYMAAGAVAVALLMKAGVDPGSVFAGLGLLLIVAVGLIFKLKKVLPPPASALD